MSARHVLGLLVAWLLLSGCGRPSGLPQTGEPVFAATVEGDGNGVTVSAAGDTAVVDVRSRSGIGAATIELVSGTLPENIIVRLHLSGLETFRLSYDQTVIAASVSSGDSHSVLQNIELPDGGTRTIASGSPLWLEVQIVSAQATPAIPLQQGYFEIRLPTRLLHDQQRSFAIRWIDFYR